MKRFCNILCLTVGLAMGGQQLLQAQEIYPFRNHQLPIEERVDDLVSRLTLEEKVRQMLNNTPAIERLGIPAYNWWNECLHGVARTKYKVTVFPQAIGMATAWDDALIKQVASTIADEGRAIYNDVQSKKERKVLPGVVGIYVGGSSLSKLLKGVEGTFVVAGNPYQI